MPITLTMRIKNSLRDMRPSRFGNAIAAAPFVDIDNLIPLGRRIVVVAPHPDDEVIGCGGILAAAGERGNPIVLIAVTDGEACYPALEYFTKQQLALIRRAETMEALRRLGVTPIAINRLQLPDGEVEKYQRVLAQQLQHLLHPNDIVISTWRFDGHGDHDVVGGICAEVAGAIGATLLEVPIWAWHWPANQQAHVLQMDAKRIALPTRWEMRKKYAMSAYATQVRPPAPLPPAAPLSKALLSKWLRDWETVFVSCFSMLWLLLSRDNLLLV
jgi:LmbE family N-acetylglucosaminyl deacetylase